MNFISLIFKLQQKENFKNLLNIKNEELKKEVVLFINNDHIFFKKNKELIKQLYDIYGDKTIEEIKNFLN